MDFSLMINNDRIITLHKNFICVIIHHGWKAGKITLWRKEGNGKWKRNWLITFMSNLSWEYLHIKLLKDTHREKSDSLTHSRRTFPRRTLSRRTLPRPDTSPTDTSPTRHIPDRHFPNQTHPRWTLPRRTLSRPEISSTDISPTEPCNATKSNVRLSIIKTHYFISYILFLSSSAHRQPLGGVLQKSGSPTVLNPIKKYLQRSPNFH